MNPISLLKLLYCPTGLGKLHPEQALAVQVANWLREKSHDGSLSAVWTHVANEGKRTPHTANILKAMGMIPGTSDYVFLWRDGSGVIELKVGNNDLTDAQKMFFEWSDANGVRHFICRSVQEVSVALSKWGVYVKANSKNRPAPNLRGVAAVPVNQPMIDICAGSHANGGASCQKSPEAANNSTSCTFEQRLHAQKIVESLCDRYGPKRTSFLLHIDGPYVAYIKNMSRDIDGRLKAPDSAVLAVLRAEKQVVLGVTA